MKINRVIEIIVLVSIYILTNLRSFILWKLFPDTYQFSGLAWREVMIWVLLILLVLYILHKKGQLVNYVLTWGKRPIVIIFVLYALISIFWSVNWTGTLFRGLVLLFTTGVTVYLYQRYSLGELMQSLFWLGVFFSFISFYLAIVYPVIGTDINPPYNGAWRGIFWHKNHLGNIMPLFNLIFLLQIFKQSSPSFLPVKIKRIIAIIFYLISLMLIYQARSASGYILVILLHFAFFVFAVWIKIHSRLRAVHYFVASALLVIGVLLVALNLDFVFGIFNREVTLTGRIPLWQYLLNQVFSERPVLGYGFGAVWTVESFRLSTQKIVGWGYPVMIGDNGFIDILLNDGIVGLLIFLIFYAQVGIASIRYLIANRKIEGLFPVIFVLYTIFVNISFSMFLELESFIWLLCVYLLFLNFPKPQLATVQKQFA